ncbi:hypothetical protein KC342_g61 [Hortaea werneckii]|nr:hypothetical protein KC342_g61 [Hortaea werneckii]
MSGVALRGLPEVPKAEHTWWRGDEGPASIHGPRYSNGLGNHMTTGCEWEWSWRRWWWWCQPQPTRTLVIGNRYRTMLGFGKRDPHGRLGMETIDDVMVRPSRKGGTSSLSDICNRQTINARHLVIGSQHILPSHSNLLGETASEDSTDGCGARRFNRIPVRRGTYRT